LQSVRPTSGTLFLYDLRVTNIVQIFEEWAPQWVAWEKDNVGCKLATSTIRSKNLVTLDVTEQIVYEAIAQKAELIVSHHPLLFGAVCNGRERSYR